MRQVGINCASCYCRAAVSCPTRIKNPSSDRCVIHSANKVSVSLNGDKLACSRYNDLGSCCRRGDCRSSRAATQGNCQISDCRDSQVINCRRIACSSEGDNLGCACRQRLYSGGISRNRCTGSTAPKRNCKAATSCRTCSDCYCISPTGDKSLRRGLRDSCTRCRCYANTACNSPASALSPSSIGGKGSVGDMACQRGRKRHVISVARNKGYCRSL